MKNLKYEDYLKLDIYPNIVNDELQFSKGNVDSLIEKYLKLQKKYNELKNQYEVNNQINYSQFDFAQASVEYYKNEYYLVKEELNRIISLNRRYDRFENINAGLRSECKKYKEKIKNLDLNCLKLKNQTVQILNEIIDYCDSDIDKYSNIVKFITDKLKSFEV